MRKYWFKICLASVCLAIVVVCILFNYKKYDNNYIAHAGGSIDGIRYTNSLEAVQHSIDLGAKYIELDLSLTSDGKLVAMHDWLWYAKITNRDTIDVVIPTYDEFKRTLIYDKYHSITYEDIIRIFSNNDSLFLVTDKISDVPTLNKYLYKIKNRMFVECFSKEDYDDCVESGYYQPMLSEVVDIPRFNDFGKYDMYVTSAKIYSTVSTKTRMLMPYGVAMFVYEENMTKSMADSIFANNRKVNFVYVDSFE